MGNIGLKDIPGFIRTTNPNDIMLNFTEKEAYNCLNSSAVIFNTFDELEHEVIDAISSKFSRSIYTIGALPMMLEGFKEDPLWKNIPELQSIGSNLWKEDSTCISWLYKKEPNSVLYVNFGSFTVISDERLKELAWGLFSSNKTFLWIIRPDVLTGYSAILPKEFFDEIIQDDRGMFSSWCSQHEVYHTQLLEDFCHIAGGILCWKVYATEYR